MDKDITSKFLDILIMNAGIATLHSKKIKEPPVAVDISLQLRPAVLKGLANMFDMVLPEQLEGEARQKRLGKSLSLFLSDAVDCGIIEGARQVAEGDLKWTL